jgi:hypothetical protein
MNILSLTSLVVATSLPAFAMAQDSLRRPAPPVASLPAPAAAGPLRILLVDDDFSDNNHNPRDSRLSPSDRIFRQVAADAVGGNAKAWEIEYVKPYASGPGIERLRPFSLIVWYTGGVYGGNPDNSGVLSIEDEKTVRRYLEEVGGAVILFSPGYLSKVLGASGTWERTDWKFLTEVLGLRGGHGLAQRFLPGVVTTPDGARFNVDKGTAVESQFSLANPARATVLFSTVPASAKPGSTAAPVATSHAYGKGRFIYVGFTFENLAAAEHAPVFGKLLAASGLTQGLGPIAVSPATTKRNPVAAQESGPVSVNVSGTPTSAVVRWRIPTATVEKLALEGTTTTRRAQDTQKPAAGASATVERLVPNGTAVRLTLASPDEMRANDPGPLTPGQAVTYRVTVTDSKGVSGSKEATFTPPLPKDPESVTASVQADGSIVLVWPEVPGVTTYQIKTSDTRIAAVIVRRATEWRSPRVDASARRWTVNSIYDPGGGLTSPNVWPSTTSQGTANTGLPTPSKAFLSVPNGAGSHAESQAHYRTRCADALLPGSLCKASGFIRDATNWEDAWVNSRERHRKAPPQWPIAAFGNKFDLGAARRVNCAPQKNGATVCWATSHGSALYPYGAPRSLSLIIMAGDRSFFGNWEWTGDELPREEGLFEPWGWSDSPLDFEHSFANHADLTSGAALDSQGRKGVPHACLSCHGGHYDAMSKQVIGASLLPVVPARLQFGQGARSKEEESIRRINQIILQSNPAPGIVDLINAMYNGAPNTPGATANDAAVPSGWSSQPGLYRQVVLPYCASCHSAQRGPVNFRSWGNMQQNKNAVQRSVCQDFTMPHSEVLFRRFWTEGGGVSLPGLLSTSLGFPTCRQ